jgi:hypothetical protein
VLQRELPFYSGVTLLRLRDPAWRPDTVRVYYLRTRAGRLFRLNGSSAPLHDVNEEARLSLDQSSALEYLRFFCFFVHGDEGPFYIVHRREDPYLPEGFWQAGKDAAGQGSRLEDVFRPPRVYGEDDDGQLRVGALVYYGTAVFLADFLVTRGGLIEMVDDIPLGASGLPARSYAPLG